MLIRKARWKRFSRGGVVGRGSFSVKCETSLQTDCWVCSFIDQIMCCLYSVSSLNRWISPSIFLSSRSLVLLVRENCKAAALSLSCVITNEVHGTCFRAWFLVFFCFFFWLSAFYESNVSKSINVCRGELFTADESSDPTDQWRHMLEGNYQSQLMLTLRLY